MKITAILTTLCMSNKTSYRSEQIEVAFELSKGPFRKISDNILAIEGGRTIYNLGGEKLWIKDGRDDLQHGEGNSNQNLAVFEGQFDQDHVRITHSKLFLDFFVKLKMEYFLTIFRYS